MMRVAAVLLVAAAACGDDRIVLEQIDAVSGTRIKLDKFIYEDGTRQVDSSSFYDARLHTRCTPRIWADEVLRCVPVAADALYTDAACTTAIGVETSLHGAVVDLDWVTHFIGYDRVEGESMPSRLYRAGDEADAITSYYERRDGMCIGPLTAPAEATYYELAEELASTAMPELSKIEAGTGRLALEMLSTLDGMRVPTGLRDRTLDAPCTATAHPGGARCEPMDAATPYWFSDSTCTVPVLVIGIDVTVPTMALLTDADGCARYTSVAGEVTGWVYRRDGDSCVRYPMGMQRALALGDTIQIPTIERTVDEAGGRRLMEVTLHDPEDPALRFTGTGLVDRATRAECRRALVGETTRCIPATTSAAFTLYSNACTVPVDVVQTPARTCTPTAFATRAALDGAGTTLHAIGNRVTQPLSFGGADSCVDYTPPPGMVLHDIGPALPPETFMSALKYGER